MPPSPCHESSSLTAGKKNGSADDPITCSTVRRTETARRFGRSHSSMLRPHPDDRLSRAIVGRAERNGPEGSARDVLLDAGENPFVRHERARQKRAERRRVDQPARLCFRNCPTGRETHTPAQEVRHQCGRVDAKHLLRAERAPEPLERRHRGGERPGVLREVSDVHCAGGDAGQDGRRRLGYRRARCRRRPTR